MYSNVVTAIDKILRSYYVSTRGGQKRKLTDVNDKEKTNKKSKQETTHTTIEEVETDETELITFAGMEKIVFGLDEEGSGFDKYVATNGAIDEHVIWYDWLADSTTTSHVTNHCEALTNYKPA